MQTLGALVGRPIAGGLVERGYRRAPAVSAIVLLAVGMCGYALTPSVALAVVAAVVTGFGAALYEVPIMAAVADGGGSEQGYGELLSYEARGSLVAFVVTFTVVSHVSDRDLFFGFAAVLGVAGVLVVRAPFPAQAASRSGGPSPARRLAPLLAVVTLTTAARAGVLLLAALGRVS